MAAQGRSSGSLRRAPRPVPSRRSCSESPGHGPVRPRSLCDAGLVAHAGSTANPGAALAQHVETMRKDASVIRFFESHRWLLSDPRFAKEARLRLEQREAHLAATQAKAAQARAELASRSSHGGTSRGRATGAPRARISALPGEGDLPRLRPPLPGRRSRSRGASPGYRTTAQNGQYLGLFQMGSSERQLFGHGASALEQAKAAHRYFVLSGRDWSPWSCKP